MRNFVDLHIHSTASDGTYAPADVVAMAERRRLAAVALTDHDTIDGLAAAQKAAAAFGDLIFVPGIEVSAKFPQGTLHILGLAIDAASRDVAALCRQLRAARDDRNPRILARLREMGMSIDMQDLHEVLGATPAGRSESGRIIGRLHIAEAMRRKKYVANTKEAFGKYLGNGCPAYVDKERLAPADAIAAIHRGGGLAVLAHPVQLKYGNTAQLERMLRQLIHDGLDGIEVYHSDHSDQQTRLYLDLAKRFKLAITGGSDFHGRGKDYVFLGRPRVPLSVVKQSAPRLLGN